MPGLGNRIVTAGMERVALADSLQAEPKTVNHTMLFQGINAIVRAARVEAAAPAEPWAHHLLVAPDQQNHCSGRKILHGVFRDRKI